MKTNNLKKTHRFINHRKLTKPTALCISALFILSILTAFSLTSVQAATTSIIGNSAVGTYRDQNDPNAQSISYFKASTTGSVTDIVAYISGASSGKALAALFAVNGNTPSTLIAQSSSVNIGTSFSWVDFQLSTSYTVSSGTTYGLAVMGNVPVNIAIVSGTGQRTGGSGYGSFAKGFTNPFGTVWFNDLTGAMSIYATGTTSSTPTATPTPTPTQTSTPTPTATPTPTQTPTPSTVSVFGNSAVGTYRDQNDPNAQSISYFKASTTGSVTDIVAYISGASSGKALAALFAVNGNTPSTLIAQSSSVNIGTSFSWVDFQLSTSYTVSSGTTYGLAVMGNVPVNIAIVSGTGQRTGGSGYGSFAKGFTNPFGTVWFNDLTGAMSIYATGTTSSTPTATPTPTPTQTSTPTPTQTPQAPPTSPSSSSALINPGFNPAYGSSVQIAHFDYGVEHTSGSPSIRVDAHQQGDDINYWREVDGNWISVKPGDHIILTVWIKTNHSTLGYDSVAGYGALLEFDCYGSTGNMFEWDGLANNQPGQDIKVTGGNTNWKGILVPWNSDWTYKQIDCIIPATVPDLYHDGQQRVVTGIIPVIVTGLYITPPNFAQDQGTVWFADAQLYINP